MVKLVSIQIAFRKNIDLRERDEIFTPEPKIIELKRYLAPFVFEVPRDVLLFDTVARIHLDGVSIMDGN